MKPGSRHSPEVRAKIAARVRNAMADPVVRQKISERTKAAMADPAVRRKISDGMSDAYGPDREFLSLVAAWNRARANVRRRFLNQMLAAVIMERLE